MAAASGFLMVALGAFGAHALKQRLERHDTAEHWRTAVMWQGLHTLALIWLGGQPGLDGLPFHLAGWGFALGILLFSGSLYLLAFSGVRRWGAVTPLGGLAWLLAWLLLGIGSI